MKILYITHYTAMYGANKSMFEVITNMKEKYDVLPIIITPVYGELNAKLDKIGIENYVFSFYSWVDSKNANYIKKMIKFLRYKLFNYHTVYKMSKFFLGKNISLIHTNASVIDSGALLASKLNIPHLWHIREFGEEDYNLIYYSGIKKATKFMEDNSKKIICISKAIKDKYKKYFIDQKKLSLIYNAVKTNDYFIDIKDKDFINFFNITFIGGISRKKNQIELIKAMNVVVNKKQLKDIKVYFLGDGDEKYSDELEKYIEEKDLTKNVFFKGNISNIKEYTQKCHVGVISSFMEGFGRVTVEYMLGGLAVIASNTGANKELITHDKDGLIYDYGDHLDLSEKIEELYFNRNKLKEISLNGQKHALENFTSDINCENIYHLYCEILMENESSKNKNQLYLEKDKTIRKII